MKRNFNLNPIPKTSEELHRRLLEKRIISLEKLVVFLAQNSSLMREVPGINEEDREAFRELATRHGRGHSFVDIFGFEGSSSFDPSK